MWKLTLRVPKVKAFDTDVLLLIVPDSAHTTHTPITLGTLHIDIAINLATKMELENLKKKTMEWEFNSNQVGYEGGSIGKPGRWKNCFSDRKYCESY